MTSSSDWLELNNIKDWDDFFAGGIPMDEESKVTWKIERYISGAKHIALADVKEYPDKNQAMKAWATILEANRGVYPYKYQYEIIRTEDNKETLIDYLSSNNDCACLHEKQ